MNSSLPPLVRAGLAATFCLSALFAQTPAPKLNLPALSPAATVKQKVGLGEVTIEYSRPSVKGRKIFGGLEPFGSVWRTGANTATKVVFSTPVKVEGRERPSAC